MIDLDAMEKAAMRVIRGSITRSANRHLASMGIEAVAKRIVTRRANPVGMSRAAIEPALPLAANSPNGIKKSGGIKSGGI